jgi:hypothetical protein
MYVCMYVHFFSPHMAGAFERFNFITVQVPWFGLSLFVCTSVHADFIICPLLCKHVN